MPASRLILFPERLNWRSYTGSAVVVEAGTLIITSYVLPAAMKTSVWTRAPIGLIAVPEAVKSPGTVLPSSAINWNPPAPLGAVDPTIEGMCMCEPALTKRTRTLPVPEVTPVTGDHGNNEPVALVREKATPLMV